MTENQPQLLQLLAKLEQLLQKQENFAREIEALRQEIEVLKKQSNPKTASAQVYTPPISPPVIKEPIEAIVEQALVSSAQPSTPYNNKLESFIGENLISKIGIVVLVFKPL